MQMPKEESRYQKSNGEFIKRNARINEEYSLSVDYMPKWRHKRLNVLLEHDYVNMENRDEFGNDSVGITCSDTYEIGWIDGIRFGLAPASSKFVLRENIHTLNSNCGDIVSYSQLQQISPNIS
jgi:hypothetical protein